jgi:hypothetical protein
MMVFSAFCPRTRRAAIPNAVCQGHATGPSTTAKVALNMDGVWVFFLDRPNFITNSAALFSR